MLKFVNLLLVFFVVVEASSSTKEKLGLYDKTDAVVILEGGNFRTNVLGSDRAWVVEFYNTWCGHCATFAPTWKAMAKQLIAWRPVITVAAVDCACENNTDICRNYDVHAFPHFLLMPPYATGEDKGVSFQEQEEDVITNLLVDFVSNVTSVERPKHWPQIGPKKNMHEIWDEARDDHKHLAFVFEEQDSYVGRQVILDMLPYKRILVRRMLRDSVKKFGITSYPSLCLINRDGTFKILSKDDPTREGYVSSLKDLLASTGDLEGAVDPHQGAVVLMELPDKQSRDRPEDQDDLIEPGVYMKDLESTLHYSFRQEIAIHRNIDGEKLVALKRFIETLVKYFPGRSEVMRFLENIYTWIKTVSTDLTGDIWLDSIDELQTLDAYLPDRVEWVGCKGSEPRFRGYPCGVWTLFHTLTISAFEHEGNSDVPLDVLDAIADYMKHFFGCRTCVTHFLQMADTITSADKTPRAAAMWLWQAHNKANSRLHGDPSEDPKHHKRLFPSRDLCPECGSENTKANDQVFRFLVKFYGKHSIIRLDDDDESADSQNNVSPAVNNMQNLDWWELHQRRKDLEKIHTLRSQKKEKLRRKKEQGFALAIREKNEDFMAENVHIPHSFESSGVIFGWGFNRFDMSMCIIFYLMCTVIILVLYYHFIVRRKHNPCKLLPR